MLYHTKVLNYYFPELNSILAFMVKEEGRVRRFKSVHFNRVNAFWETNQAEKVEPNCVGASI